jgi:hypothetical protein
MKTITDIETSLIELTGLEFSPLTRSIPDWLSTGSDTKMSTDLKIGKARNCVMTRLNILEQSLPSRPIKVAKALVKEIWVSYDTFPNETRRIG